MFLIFFTIAAWYEGSTILDKPWEWKYSAIFTQLLHGEAVNQQTISQLDYFVYAAKFKPAYPLLMMISSMYLVILIGYRSLKNSHKGFALFLFILGISTIAASRFVSHSPTSGGAIFAMFLLASGILYLAVGLTYYLRVVLPKKKVII